MVLTERYNYLPFLITGDIILGVDHSELFNGTFDAEH